MRNLSFSLLAILFFSSCIKTEPLNPEADILRFIIPDSASFVNDIRISGTNNTITVIYNPGSKIDYLAPRIITSPGATVFPESGSIRNFKTTRTYTVCPQNGVGKKIYSVNFVSYFPMDYRFEEWKSVGKEPKSYDVPHELLSQSGSNIEFNIWDSGNPGIALYMSPPYPTTKTTLPNEVHGGRSAVKMTTMKGPGKILGGILNIPVVAGSLFMGEFKLEMSKPVTSPKLGYDCQELPVKIEGYYKYREGEGDYINSKGNPIAGQSDSCSIYSLLYEVTDKRPLLDGGSAYFTAENGDIYFAENVVAYAWMPRTNRSQGDDFIHFEIPYTYPYGKEAIDLKNKRYKFTALFSSSYRGDYYEGKTGSVLIVDDVTVTTE